MNTVLRQFFSRWPGVIRVADNILFSVGQDTIGQTCTSHQEGGQRWRRGGVGVASVLETCLKTSTDTYAWGTVATLADIPSSPVIVGSYSGTWAPASLAADAGQVVAVTITGALTTDFVEVSHTGARSNSYDVWLEAYISSANTVTVHAYNRHPTTAHTLGSGTLTVRVTR